MTEDLPPTSRPSRPSGEPDESRLRALADSLRAEVDEDALRNDDLRYLAAARETLTLWGEWWGPARPVSVPRNMEVKLQAVYPLALHALNCVAISLDMHERLPWVATALARVAFEHALTAQWVLLTHDGEHLLHAQLRAEGHKRAAAFHRGLGSPEKYEAMVGEPPPASGWSVWNACARFSDAPDLFYDVYRNLGGATHPSYGTLLAYLDTTDEGEVVSLNPVGAARGCDELPRALAMSALWALNAVEELRENRPHVADLLAVGNAAGVPTCLRDSDQHPERQQPPGPAPVT